MDNFGFNIIKRFKHWLKDSVFNRLLKNSAILLSGNIVATVLSFISFTIVARVLGAEQFGILIIIQTYTRIVDRLINFQSWQALIKYGAEALEHKNLDKLKGLLKFGVLLDLTTAILGTIIAIIGSFYLSQWQGWDIHLTKLTWIYCLAILFNLTGTPTAILRLFDHFKIFSIQEILAATVRLVLIIFAALTNAKFFTYFVIWLCTDILAYLLLIPFALIELRKNNIKHMFKQPLGKVFKEHKGILGFVCSANLSTAIRVLSREFDIIIIGGILGGAMAGLFKVAKQFANLLIRITDPLFYAIYPELAKLWANSQFQRFKKVTFRTGLSAGGCGIILWFIFLIFGKQILYYTVGSQYLSAYFTMIIYAIAMVIAVAVSPLSPAIFATGKHKIFLYAISIATAVYFCCLPSFLITFKITGAAYAYIIFYIVYSTIMMYFLNKILLEKPVITGQLNSP